MSTNENIHPNNKKTTNGKPNDAINLESMVTPEQVLSASVARNRRNVTKRRSQLSGSNRIVTRDKTPVREKTPARELEPEIIQEKPPARPTRRRSREIRLSDLSQESSDGEHRKTTKPSVEVLKLLDTAKRSLSSDRSRKPVIERKAIIKRSQSTPRECTIEDTDLIESFKKAQRLSAEVGTSSKLQYASSEESIPSEVSSTSEEENRKEDLILEKQELKRKLKLIKKEKVENQEKWKKSSETIPLLQVLHPESPPQKLKSKLLRNFVKEAWQNWKQFVRENQTDYRKIKSLRNRCLSHVVVLFIICGLGGMAFRFTEGAFENFYKCGVKRVKRDFIDSLWLSSHNLREDDWKSLARRKLMDFEEQLYQANEAGVNTYSGQRAWSFMNAIVYCITVVTTIGYGHITPSTTTGRVVTIIYAIFGIPIFLILLADFGKLFTRSIKFVWAFVRRLYYTGSCRKVRKTDTVQSNSSLNESEDEQQGMMQGMQMVYDMATFRRPSQINLEDIEIAQQMPPQLGTSPPLASSEGSLQSKTPNYLNVEGISLKQGIETPITPVPSNFAVDDDFNLPVSVAIVILLLYLLSGALMYWLWEKDWSFFESFYFVFISMSTIGFGDFVPNHPMYMMASILYLIFGLALTSMCINVVQVKLSDTFRQASAKISATIGLAVADDDGSLAQAAAQPEIAEVHQSNMQSSIKKDKEREAERAGS